MFPDVRNIILWKAPFACTVTAVRGYRVGGAATNAFNARKLGTTNFLSANKAIASADTWTDGTLSGTPADLAVAATDKVEIMITEVTSNPSQMSVQIDFTRP